MKKLDSVLKKGTLLAILAFVPALAMAQNSDVAKTRNQAGASARDGQHDFDFEIGTWKTHLKRLIHPLSDSNTWVEYDGTTVVRKVWNGRANLVELDVNGPAGHIEALSLRLYNPSTHQWSLNFANSAGGTMGQPTIGEFKNGRGEFFDQETLNGRAILVRFVISDITPNSCRFEQAFSDDGGKTWEVNWIATDTRMKGGSGPTDEILSLNSCGNHFGERSWILNVSSIFLKESGTPHVAFLQRMAGRKHRA
jgi:hypothetical protein